jgi:hypothetical protein
MLEKHMWATMFDDKARKHGTNNELKLRTTKVE